MRNSFIANTNTATTTDSPGPPVITDLQYSLDNHELQSFAAQVASGMVKIFNIKFLGRQLFLQKTKC